MLLLDLVAYGAKALQGVLDMKYKGNGLRFKILGSLVALGLSLGTAHAAPIMTECQPAEARSTGDYFMTLTTDSPATCLDSGVGEPSLTGNPLNDTFLIGDYSEGYEFIAKNDSSDVTGNAGIFFSGGSSGSWSFDESLWDSYLTLAIGFKFGGGDKAESDTWFVYELTKSDYQGAFDYSENKGLSHVNLYGKTSVSVPEPGTIALLGLGLIGIALGRKRK